MLAVSGQRPSGLIHSDDSEIERNSSTSRHESRNRRERHPSGRAAYSAKPLVTSHASGLRATNSHSRSYTNPRLQARVLPARSQMVTTLIAQIIRFARPNIQVYDARVADLYQWVCARYRVGV
jgi:hypothetical protein